MTRLRIETFEDGSFQRSCFGYEATVIPVLDRWRETIDTLAWFDTAPQSWWRLRLIGQVLGDKALLAAEWEGLPVHLYETPAGWWAAKDPKGVCVIDWTADPRLLLNSARLVVCETERLRKRLLKKTWDRSKPHFELDVGIDGRQAA